MGGIKGYAHLQMCAWQQWVIASLTTLPLAARLRWRVMMMGFGVTGERAADGSMARRTGLLLQRQQARGLSNSVPGCWDPASWGCCCSAEQRAARIAPRGSPGARAA